VKTLSPFSPPGDLAVKGEEGRGRGGKGGKMNSDRPYMSVSSYPLPGLHLG